MPFAGEYREAMGLPVAGDLLGGFLVEDVKVGHEGVGPGRYEYPMELIVRGKGGQAGARSALKALFATRRTIFSGYGNPYQCSMGRMEVESLGEGRYRVSSRGLGTRVHLKAELERFLAHLEDLGLLPEGSGDGVPGAVVEEYLRLYQLHARRPAPRSW